MKRKDFQLIGVNDDFLSLMDDTGDMREDLKCPEDAIGEEIKAAIEKDADILVTAVFQNGTKRMNVLNLIFPWNR